MKSKIILIILFIYSVLTLPGCNKENPVIPTTTTVYTGYIVGNSGKIYKSNDQGSSWSELSSGVSTKLNAVYAISSTDAIAVGDYGTILKTTNGGTNWTVLTSNTSVNLKNISYNSSTKQFWISGDNGVILYASN